MTSKSEALFDTGCHTVGFVPSKENTPLDNEETNSSPSWHVLFILAHQLDIKTLAISSCVSKSWYNCFTLDHHWKLYCESRYPSLSHLRTTTQASYHRLYAIGRAATQRRIRTHIESKLPLDDLIFIVQLKTASTNSALPIIVPCGDLLTCPNGRFKFFIDMKRHACFRPTAVPKDNNVVVGSWSFAVDDMQKMFCIMECEGELGGSEVGLGKREWYFSKEIKYGLVAEVRLGFSGQNGVVATLIWMMALGIYIMCF